MNCTECGKVMHCEVFDRENSDDVEILEICENPECTEYLIRVCVLGG